MPGNSLVRFGAQPNEEISFDLSAICSQIEILILHFLIQQQVVILFYTNIYFGSLVILKCIF